MTAAALPFVDGAYSIVVLPDTQGYVEGHPEHFFAQTRWIADHVASHNIQYVIHLGDITHRNTPEQWELARSAMKNLDGRVPYALVTGNHDHGIDGRAERRETHFNQHFRAHENRSWPGLGGLMEEDRLDNSFHVFDAAGRRFLIVALEWAPRDRAVVWANEVVARHPDHHAILVTHAYLYYDDTRYDWRTRGRSQRWAPPSYGMTSDADLNDGQQLFDKLVRRHGNFVMTLSGHVLGDGVGHLVSEGDRGNEVHQILSNYQHLNEGGEGWLRLVEFLPGGSTVQVRTYSPSLDQYKTDVRNQFRFEMRPVFDAAPDQE